MTIETLSRLAAAFKVGLVVKFVPFSEMQHWENAYSQDEFHVTNIDKDLEFQSPTVDVQQATGAIETGLLGMESSQHPAEVFIISNRRPVQSEAICNSLAAAGGM